MSYPVPPRSRGVLALVEENCTVCMICARECPDWCIHISSHTEIGSDPRRPGRRPVARAVLDRFAIDYGRCLYCGICVEACPFDALAWAAAYAYPGTSPDGAGAAGELVHERDRLGSMVALPGVGTRATRGALHLSDIEVPQGG